MVNGMPLYEHDPSSIMYVHTYLLEISGEEGITWNNLEEKG